MAVKLISYSSAAPQGPLLDASLIDLVAYCARVSNPSNQMNKKTAKGLVKYLIKHKHWSPLEMVSICLEIETTRDIARQILRHRSFTFQEFSQRYADPTEDLYFVRRGARMQDKENRQNSLPCTDQKLLDHWDMKQQAVIAVASDAYRWAIDHGIAKEQARALLPEGCTMSRMYVNGSLRSWIHYIDLRGANGTQLEHIYIAQECAKVISEVFPIDGIR